MTMTFERFFYALNKPSYVVKMAHGKMHRTDAMGRGATTAYERAKRQIDDLVLQRAQVIADERRCAAVAEIDNPKGPYLEARCEFQKGHGPVGPGIENPRLSHVTVRTDWDHGAPSKGKWWKTNPTQKENADG